MKENLYADRYKHCKGCGKALPSTYIKDLCPYCEENQLFDDVRDFIREYDVTEQQVAEHFGISTQKVKSWIKEGRIEYKENGDTKNIMAARCSRCGEPITFGTLCSRCLKLMNSEKYEYIGGETEKSKMRFLDQNKDNE